MRKLLLLTLIFILVPVIYSQSSVRFGVIGDYGDAGPDELAVANLIKSWNPDFIITLGDNNYDIGSQATIDQNIGQYFHEFIYPYYGSYGPGALVNKFFPSLGNHDWGVPGALPYLNYFTLPGNERYYDFIKGPVHFFVMDSDTNEYDGRDSNSIQAQWLKNALRTSSSRFNIVYLHHPPYCSGIYSGSEEIVRWPYKRWGASAVMSGHEHLYERITRDGLTYFVNGLGGSARSFFGFPLSGSQVRYRSNFGAMLVNAYEDSLVLKFYNIANSLIDNYKILPSVKTLTLNAEIEGFYNAVTNSMKPDTVRVYLRNSYAPYSIADSSKGILNSGGTGTFTFSKADNATGYYVTVDHRNSIEIWSSIPNQFIVNALSYDFTSSSLQAFGNNMILKGLKYCLFSGDAAKDGYINLTDVLLIYNDAKEFKTGYILSDVNGDSVTDLDDELITYNNSINFVSAVFP
ncbi:MAG: metallophosphoesterase [Ignavibacteria bacterium]|nr:metallophosphoesterase [Ignavibacteria bacterium]